MLLGVGLAVGAIEMLHAQAKPPAYLISAVTIIDPAGYKEYADKFAPTLVPFGGKFIVRAGQTVALPGAGEPPVGRDLVYCTPSTKYTSSSHSQFTS